MLKRILVALDSSNLSAQVITTVQQLQLPADAEIVVAHVLDQSKSDLEVASDRPPVSTEAIPKDSLEKLEAYQAALPTESSLEVVAGDPAEEIIRLANIHKTDLIVIGSRGLTGVDRILQRSVSSQVVEEAHCSVLVVRPIA
ncbi:universal stress protein [Phormidium tenue FACHB-886]|nr:universal stress protein [Phormidium tenue FACHB-886]